MAAEGGPRSHGRSIDRKARMAIRTNGLPLRPVAERARDFGEALAPLTPEWAIHEASRCIHCPDPAPCQKACPVSNNVSEALWRIEEGRFDDAANIYRATSSMPEICGRVCPHEHLCQGVCPRNKQHEPVLCGALEVFVVDWQRNHGGYRVMAGIPTGKRVAVIGSGPAGLGCAEQLARRGHEVIVFEAMPFPGGLLMYGIPGFTMTNAHVKQLVLDLSAAGVRFVCNTRIGRDKTIDSLLAEGHDAVFIGTGAKVDSPIRAPGDDLPGVWKATEFLVRANVESSLLPPEWRGKPQIGRRVVVVGGGDTASDCVRTAVRLGAESVTCVYRRTENEMPGSKKDRGLAREEGVKYEFLTQPVKFIAGADGRLVGVECIRMQLGEPDAGGRRRPVPVADSNFTIEAETAVLALGYQGDPEVFHGATGLATHDKALLVTDERTGATSRPGVFAGGDVAVGPDLVVTAQAMGRRAAEAIDAYLKTVPTSGALLGGTGDGMRRTGPVPAARTA